MNESTKPAEGRSRGTAEAEPAEASSRRGDRRRSRRGRHFREERGYELGLINTRFVLISLLLVMAVAVTVWGVHWYQQSRMSSLLLTRAEAAETTDWRKSRNLLVNYQHLQPDDIDAKLKLARLQMENAETGNDYLKAFETNEEILRNHPEHDDLRRQHVDLVLRLGRFSDARDHLIRLLEKDPENGALHLLTAITYREQGEYEKAAGEFSRALEDKDFESVKVVDREFTRVLAYAAWAQVLSDHLKRPGPAADKYDRMVSEHPQSAEAYLYRADFRRRRDMLPQAASDARRAMSLDPENIQALVAAAELTLIDEESTEAQIQAVQQALSDAVEAGIDDGRVYRLASFYKWRQGDSESALETLRRGVEQATDNGPLMMILATRLADQGPESREQLNSLTTGAAADSLSDAEAEYVQACLLRQEGRHRSALEHFIHSRRSFESGSEEYQNASLQIAKCYQALGHLDAALNEFQRVRSANPHSIEARVGVASVHQLLRQFDAALEAYRSMSLADPELALNVAQIEFQRAQQEPSRSERWTEVERAISKAEDLGADAVRLALLRSQILIARDEVDAARELLLKVQEEAPDSVEPRAALAQLALVVNNDPETAGAILDEAEQRFAPNLQLDMLRLEYWRRTDAANLRTHLAVFENREYPDRPDWWIQSQEVIAGTYQLLGDEENQLRILLNVANAYPDHVIRWYRLIGPALDLNRSDVVDQALQQLEQIEGETGLHVRMAKAVQFIYRSAHGDKSHLAEARSLLNAALKDASPQGGARANLHELLARVDLLEGRRKDAAEQYLLAVNQGNRSPALLLTAAQLLIEQQRSPEALELLKSVPSPAADSPNPFVALMTAGLLSRANQQSDAVELARSLVTSNPENAAARIYLAQLLSVEGDADAAEQEIRKAIELQPSFFLAWIALVDHLRERGDLAAAEAAIAEAEQAINPDQRAFALAICYERVNRIEDAEAQYQSAVEAHPTNAAVVQQLGGFYLRTGQPQRARAILQPMLDDPSEFEGANVIVIRRLMARALAGSSYTDFAEAVRLVEQNIQEAPDPLVDRRIYAQLLFLHPHPDFLVRALGQYREIEQLTSLTPVEHVQIARANDLLDDRHEADRHWDAALDSDQPPPQVIAAYIRRQLDQGQLAGISLWTRQLQSLQPDGFETAELQARYHVQNGDVRAALAGLSEFSDRSADETVRHERQMQVAGLLSELSRSHKFDSATRSRLENEADALYRQLIPDHPEAAIPHAVLLGHRGELSAALDELEQALPSVPEVQIAAAGVQLLQTCDHDAAAAERVQGWVDACRRSNPNSLFAIHIEESLNRIRRRYDEAIKLNQAILTQVPANAVALNNLAWLLSATKDQHEAALQLISKAINAVGPKSFLLDTRALIYLKQGRVDESIKEFEASWIQDPLPATEFHWAWALHQAGNRDAARDHLMAAIDGGLTPRSLEHPEVAVFQRLSEELATGYNAE